MNNGTVNLLLTIDKKYLSPTLVMLESYIKTNDRKTDIYIAHSSLEESDFEQLNAVVSGSCVTVHNCKITEKWFSDIPVLERLPEESFYRLLAFDFLPHELDRCLYLDPDIIIRRSIGDLYDSCIDGKYLAACSHMYGFKNTINKLRLGLGKNQERYINSGVMLLNLELIRRDFTIKSILNSLEENVNHLLLGDQDMANILFGENILLLDERIYNLDERTYKYRSKKEGFSLSDIEEKTAIIHYNGKCKPWLNGYEGMLAGIIHL